MAEECTLVGAWTTLSGWGLILGLVLSFAPQFATILWNKDSTGVSLLTCWLVSMSALSSVVCANLIEWQIFTCCFGATFLDCNNYLLSYYQILSRFIVVFPMYLIALIYHPTNPANGHIREKNEKEESVRKSIQQPQKDFSLNRVESESEGGIDHSHDPEVGTTSSAMGFLNFEWLRFWDMFVILLVAIFFFTALSIFAIASDFHYGTSLATVLGDVFGTFSAIVTSCIWIPQIIYLYQNKDEGSLSLVLFVIQAPGGLFMVYFQAVLEGEPPSIWIGILISAFEQFIIICQILYYRWTNPRPVFEEVEDKEVEKLIDGRKE